MTITKSGLISSTLVVALLLLCGCRPITEPPSSNPTNSTNGANFTYGSFRFLSAAESVSNDIIEVDYHSHTYLAYHDTLTHAQNCRCQSYAKHMTVTNITYVTLTNTVYEIPDDVWKKYEELRGVK